MRRLYALVFLLPATAWADAFGGWAQDGSRYLVGKDQVCAPLQVKKDGSAQGAPACELMSDRKARAALAFEKPQRAKTIADGRRLAAEVDRQSLQLTVTDDKGAATVLARWAASEPLERARGVFLSSTGGIAVEYQTAAGRVDVVAFDLAPSPPPGATSRPAAPGPPGPADTAYQRALGAGGVWEQRLVPCEEAGVNLSLDKARKFNMRIETRCQGHKDVTKLDGTWVPEGADQLVLQLPNQDGTVETMGCRFSTCADSQEDCLTCAQEDVAFTLQVVRR